jgi:nitrate/nitrite transporter NarK
VITDWFPLARRGIVSSVMAGSMQLGAITATALTARLLDPLGWRLVLRGYATAGIVWAVVFWFWFRNHPEEHPATNQAERDVIRAGRVATAPVRTGLDDWLRLGLAMLSSVSLWAFFAQGLFRAYFAEFFYAYCPAYLEYAHGVDRGDAGQLAAYPVVALGIGSVLSGFVVDWLLLRTGSKYVSRCGAGLVGMVLCSGCFALATQVHSARVVIVLLSAGALFMSLGAPANWAAAMDIGGRHTPVVIGAGNMMGNIGAFLCPLHVGRLITFIKASDEPNWNLVLWLFVAISAASAAAWVFVNPRRPLINDEARRTNDERMTNSQ